MATTKAKTRQDVDNMTTEDQLWDSLNYNYDRMKDKSNKSYAKQVSELQNTLLKRGMQRSSYAGAVEGALRQAGVEAADDIESQKIAAYEDRLGQERDKQWQRDFQERQLAQNQSQFEANLGLSKEQFGLSKEQFAEQKAQNAWSQKFQQQQADIAQQNTLWNQKFQEANANREQANADRAYNYQVGRDTVSDAQWEKENARQDKQLDYNISSGDRAYYASWVQQAAALDNDVSDEMLAKAGLSRDDFNAMRAEAAAVTYGGGGGGGRYYSPKGNPDDAATGLSDEDIANLFGSNAAYIAGQTAAKAAGKNKSSKGSGVIVNNPNYWTTAYKKKG